MSKGPTPSKLQPSTQTPAPKKTREDEKPANVMEKHFAPQPNTHLPRAVLPFDHPVERAWRFLSLKQRSGLDPLDVVDRSPFNSLEFEELRHTLELSGAFLIANADKNEYAEQPTEEQLLVKWERASRWKWASAKPFVPANPLPMPTPKQDSTLLGHQMADRARFRKSPMGMRQRPRAEIPLPRKTKPMYRILQRPQTTLTKVQDENVKPRRALYEVDSSQSVKEKLERSQGKSLEARDEVLE